MTLLIRAETGEDCEPTARAHLRAWQVGYRGMLPDEVLDSLDLAQWVERRRELLETGPCRSLVAERDGEIVGFVRFGPDREDDSYGEIQAIYVHPDHWGCGAGKALMEAALEALPHKEVRLWVLELNKRAQRFYERFGLHPDGTRSTFTPRGSDFEAPEFRLVLSRG